MEEDIFYFHANKRTLNGERHFHPPRISHQRTELQIPSSHKINVSYCKKHLSSQDFTKFIHGFYYAGATLWYCTTLQMQNIWSMNIIDIKSKVSILIEEKNYSITNSQLCGTTKFTITYFCAHWYKQPPTPWVYEAWAELAWDSMSFKYRQLQGFDN